MKIVNATLSNQAFGVEFNESLVHQIVVAYMSSQRAGTKAQKTRAKVRGGGIKPWRQKGTGRARAGTTRSPIWRTGGRTFAAKPRDYAQKVNKKMYKGAMRCIYSRLYSENRLILVDELKLDAPKTKDLLVKLKDLGVTDALLVSDQIDENLYLASRNLHKIQICDLKNVDPVSLISYEKILVTLSAIKKIEEQLI